MSRCAPQRRARLLAATPRSVARRMGAIDVKLASIAQSGVVVSNRSALRALGGEVSTRAAGRSGRGWRAPAVRPARTPWPTPEGDRLAARLTIGPAREPHQPRYSREPSGRDGRGRSGHRRYSSPGRAGCCLCRPVVSRGHARWPEQHVSIVRATAHSSADGTVTLSLTPRSSRRSRPSSFAHRTLQRGQRRRRGPQHEALKGQHPAATAESEPVQRIRTAAARARAPRCASIPCWGLSGCRGLRRRAWLPLA